MNTLPPSSPPLARIVNSITQANHALDHAQFQQARGIIPGWSQPFHYTFFGHVLASFNTRHTPQHAQRVIRVLVCGVYHGLDLALIQHAAKLLGIERNLRLTGVDLFSADPCADWPEEKRGMTWGQAFGCEPPSIDAARRNAPHAEIVQASSVAYLAEHARHFDVIYLDTSHDERTVRSEIEAIRFSRHGGLIPPVRPLLLAGDDYHQPGTCWGVDKAVTEHFPHHVVFFNRIWLAQL